LKRKGSGAVEEREKASSRGGREKAGYDSQKGEESKGLNNNNEEGELLLSQGMAIQCL